MTYAIIRNAPPAEPVVSLYPFGGLDVFDGFDAPRDLGRYPCGRDRRQAILIALARRWHRRTGRTFTVRVLDADTVRVRRTS